MSGKPRLPANRERMRDLMRDVMIRNTRSLVDVHLPRTPRPCAWSLALKRPCLSGTDAAGTAGAPAKLGAARLALRHLLAAAGSHATTAAATIELTAAHRVRQDWRRLQTRYTAIQQTSKERALCDVLRRNPHERKIVFVHHRETWRGWRS